MLNPEAIKQRALEIGFDLCGIAPATDFPELKFLSDWIARGYAGEMDYLEKSAAVRADIRNFLPTARSVIVMGTVYNTEQGSGIRDQGSGGSRRDQGRAIRSRAGLSQGHRGSAARADRVDGRSEPGPVRGSALRRQAPGAGTRLRASRRHWVDRQELVRDQPRAGIVDVLVGHRDEPGAGARRPCARSMRCVLAVHRCLSDRCARRRARARRDPVHLLSHHRDRS